MEFKLHDAEYRLMEIIWENEPVNSTALCKICLERLGWKKSTTYTMLRRLVERELLSNENATVTALRTLDEVRRLESDRLIEKSFSGSLPMFIASFLDGRNIKLEEAEELKNLIDNAIGKEKHND